MKAWQSLRQSSNLPNLKFVLAREKMNVRMKWPQYIVLASFAPDRLGHPLF